MAYSDFGNRIKSQFPEKWEELLASINNEPFTSIRHNPRKIKGGIESDVPWSRHGCYLRERPRFVLDPRWHQGLYYVQESSSMFVDHILSTIKKEIYLDKVLDLCAAPGGKSTIVLDHLEKNQFLISNELISQRNSILRENLTKWGYPNFLITENKPKDFQYLPNYFDCILLDAPCSGEGLFRKDINARKEWSIETATMCSVRQKEIFHSIWSCLREGGILIYSTCTFNPDENEFMLEKLLDDGFEFETLDISLPHEWNIETVKTKNIIGYQFLPHKVKGEGFFCSILRKKGRYVRLENKISKDYIHPYVSSFLDLDEWQQYSSYKFKNSLFLAPNALLDELSFLNKHLYIRQIGLELARFQNNEPKPEHGLAMLIGSKKGLNIEDVSYDQALNFLAHRDLELDLSAGIYLAYFEGKPLGFFEASKSSIINLYPSGWKIRITK